MSLACKNIHPLFPMHTLLYSTCTAVHCTVVHVISFILQIINNKPCIIANNLRAIDLAS